MLLTSLQCTRELPMTKNYVVRNVNSAKLKESRKWSNSFPLSFLTLLCNIFKKWLRASAQTALEVGDSSLSKAFIPYVHPPHSGRYSLHQALSALPPLCSASWIQIALS